MLLHRLVLVALCFGCIASAADPRPGTQLGTQLSMQLIEAVKRQDAAAVRALLARKVKVSATEADGSTALHWAAQRNNAKLVDTLIAAGANVKTATRYNITPLYFACLNGNVTMVASLLKAGADPNSTAEEGQTALMTASLAGNVDVVKLLLSKGAKVDTAEPYRGQSALMWAASEGNTATAEMLVEFGASLKPKSKGGLTAFLFAVRNGHIATAQALLDHGADVNDVAPDGTSALNMAVVNAYFELAAALLDHGANPNASDPRGSALHTIAWLRKPGTDGAAGVGNTPHGPPPPTGNLSALDLAKKLLEKGANPNVRISWMESRFGKEGGTARNPPNIQLGRHFLSYVGATPFYVASKNGDVPLMRVLLAAGADPKMPSKAGITPLMAAAGLDYWEGEAPGPFAGLSEAERLDAVKLAHSLGNDINAQADFGDYAMEGETAYTLLYYPLNIDKLVDLGVGDPRWSGSSALIGAVISGQSSIVRYLIDQGAKLDMKTKLGWTPLMVAEGVFFANAKKEYPQAAAIIREALTGQQTSAKKTEKP
ncbi:MAG: ankyrin repeat domain-containing protein [Acidobacteriota bacterium]